MIFKWLKASLLYYKMLSSPQLWQYVLYYVVITAREACWAYSSVVSHRFEYNPCSPFYCQLDTSAAVCVANWLPTDTNLGTQSSAVFKETYDPFSITISYSNPPYRSDVTFECRHNVGGKFYIEDVSDAQYYKFRVWSNAIVAPSATRTHLLLLSRYRVLMIK